jgi:hypothetical protein
VIRATHVRRLAELRAKLASLRDELDSWRALTEQTPALRRHFSQIRLLDATLTAMLTTTRDELANQPEDESVLDKGVDWENEMLAAHSIWEVFRSKYVLRQNETFRDYLAACDDVAWACYEPALLRFAPGTKREPPLVFLSATWSPFAQSRDTNFQNEIRLTSSGVAALSSDEFQQVLKRLPFPLVSLPWYQAFHLPGANIIAHEVGHVVDNDFGIRAQILARLDAANLKFATVWKGWAAEMFADIYGCLAMGPAFVGAMLDLLATSASGVQKERRLGGTHPTRALRAQIILRVLALSGYADDALRLRSAWEKSFPATKVMDDVAAEMNAVIDIILAGPYHGAALTEVISLPPSGVVKQMRAYAGQGQALQLRQFDASDPRYLFAAAQLLHEDPVANQKGNAFQLLVAQAMRKGTGQFRSQGKPVATQLEVDQQLAARLGACADQGVELRKLLTEPRPASPAVSTAPPDPQTP